MADVIKIINTVIANSSAEVQARIPTATKDNLAKVGEALVKYDKESNEFFTNLINRIGMQLVKNKILTNPLAKLKQAGVPYGKGVQELYVNPAKSSTFTYDSQDLLKIVKSDVKVNYYNIMRQDKYPVTVTEEMIMQAFTSPFAFESLLNGIVSSIYSGDNFDEFILMKNLVATAFKNNHILKEEIYKEVDNPTNQEVAQNFINAIRITSKAFAIPSSANNSYAVANEENKLVTATPPSEQILLINSTMSAIMETTNLAYVYNLSKAETDIEKIEVDCFADQPILGILVDKAFFRVFDNLFKVKTFENGDNLSMKYILHHWQTYGYSTLCNAKAFYYTPKPTE